MLEYSAAYKKIYKDLLTKIKNNEIKIGDQLPSEMQLAEEYSVSRITSKKAFELLVADGYVSRRRGKGSYLISNDVSNVNFMKEKGSLTAACILTDFSYYATGILHGIEKYLSENNINLLLKLTKGDDLVERRLIRELKDNVDGFIILPVQNQYFSQEMLQLIVEKKPLVLVDRKLKELPAVSVSTNNLESSIELVKYLLEKNVRGIGLISPPIKGTSSVEDRVEGYITAHQYMGLVPNTDFILSNIKSTIPNCDTKENSEADLEEIKNYLIRLKGQIKAIFAIEYNIALMIEYVLKELNCDEFNEIEIVCFDYPVNMYVREIKYTHIAQNEEKMGYIAGEKLNQMMKEEIAPESMLVDGKLVLRE